jgi:glycerophosphoryl diester phosphodiesterase
MVGHKLLQKYYTKFVLYAEKPSEANDNGINFTDHVLVAHAGGALFDGGEIYTYTDSLEAILLNYKKGYRVFEIDFNLTKDGKLAAVHDWKSGKNITGMTAGDSDITLEEWKRQTILEMYTPMDIDDVINIMNTYTDIYLVTDTKDTDHPSVLKAFSEIYEAAKKVDLNIINRIIPQIYHPQMLKTIYSVYPFQNVIYTLYQSLQSPKEVVEFVREHPSIKAVTMWKDTVTEEFVRDLSNINRPVYVHTINKFTEALKLYKIGVHGFYTDYLNY